MRAILVLLIILVCAAIAAIYFGYVAVDQTRPARLPQVRVSGGQAPAFNVQTPDVSVGNKAVEVPTVNVQKPQ